MTDTWDLFGRAVMALGLLAMLSYLAPAMVSVSPAWARRFEITTYVLIGIALVAAVAERRRLRRGREGGRERRDHPRPGLGADVCRQRLRSRLGGPSRDPGDAADRGRGHRQR